ncbi:MAG TPA: ABC transporter permease subunit [bacterium]|uniref:ABC-2 family transporter protein n=1 Tax=candidate division TA06 bacterium ADurb.Bin417 TaxID=1852828 RepID=A0A1V5MI57_UNCT6|nr:MAG: ABC-2 family transporter protein [candidate division TA06 bacterium ADurb.Bin417]HNQ34916.1 ABC transporter permease subunit [bacterium]HNS48178.1 ABC transporter permease subunit [bacterium]
MVKALIIGLNTFRETLRLKSYQIILIFALLLLGSSQLFSFLTPEEQLKMIKDVSLSGIEIFAALLAIFTAMTSLRNEFETNTISTLLSKPLRRSEFILGKFIGSVLAITLSVILMAAVFSTLILIKQHSLEAGLFSATFLIWAEMLVIVALTLAVAAFASTAFTLIFVLFLFLTGHLTGYGLELAQQAKNPLLQALTKIFYKVIPNFENFAIRDEIAVGVSVSLSYLLKTFGYGLIYTFIALLLCLYFFQFREV